MPDYFEKIDSSPTLENIAAGGNAVVTLTFDGLYDDINAVLELLEIMVQHVSGTAPTSVDLQVWNKANADHWTNKDGDITESVYKKTGLDPGTARVHLSKGVDWGELLAWNRDTTANAKNRLYVGLKVTGGDGTGDYAVRVVAKNAQRSD